MKPLDGIRILEVSQVYSLPFAGQMLAELGADVIKVENPKSPEVMRLNGYRRGNVAAGFFNLNRGKRFLGIDGTLPEGREALAKLVATADVVIDNLRPGKMAKIGLDWETLHERHPQLIAASVTGFGEDGPFAHLPCYDFVVQAMVGMVDFQRDPDTGTFDLVRHYVVDKSVGHAVVEGVMGALLMRGRTGKGDRVLVNMLDTGAHFLWPDGMIPHTLVGEVEMGGRDGAPMRVYPTTDGAVVMMPPLHDWAQLCCAMNKADMAGDERFAERAARVVNFEALLEEMRIGIAVMSTDEIIANCEIFDVAVARVDKRTDLFDNAQAVWNHTADVYDVPKVGLARIPQSPWRYDDADVAPSTSIHELGGHTTEILSSLGYEDGAIQDLLAAGVAVQP